MRARGSTEANLWSEWPELHLLRRGEFLDHREAARKPLRILLPGRAVAVGIDLRLLVKLHQIIAGEFPQLKRLEEEVKAKARERMLKPTGPGVLSPESILKTLKTGRTKIKRRGPNERIAVRSLHAIPRRIEASKKTRLQEMPGVCPGPLKDLSELLVLSDLRHFEASSLPCEELALAPCCFCSYLRPPGSFS